MNIKLYTNGRDHTVVVFAEPALGLRLGEEATLASFDLLSVNRKYENISLGILGPVYTPVVGRNCRIVYWKKVRVYQEQCPLTQGKLAAFAAQTDLNWREHPSPSICCRFILPLPGYARVKRVKIGATKRHPVTTTRDTPAFGFSRSLSRGSYVCGGCC